MQRIFPCSRIISSKSNLLIPRRELSVILLGVKKVFALAGALGIEEAKLVLHSGSTIGMYWLGKEAGILKTFVAN